MKLDKKTIRKIIIEEIYSIQSKKLWEIKRVELDKKRKDLISKGYSPKRIDENLGAAIANMGSRLVGLGGAEYFGPESQGLFGGDGGFGSGVKTAIQQSALEMVVRKVGLDPYTGYGIILKNVLERVIRKYSTEDLAMVFSGKEGCSPIAFEISREVLIILEEASKERVLKFALDSIAGEFGADVQTSPFFKPFYQNVRERFSEAFEGIMNEDELAESLSDIICDSFAVPSLLDTAKDGLSGAAQTAFGEFANAINQLDFPFSN